MSSDKTGQTIQEALAIVRQKIDGIDSTLLELLSQRAQCAREVGEIKARFGDDGFIYRPEREAQVLRRLQALNQGPLADETITRLFREVMSACLALEQPIGVAFLGPLGTFSESAAVKQFGHAARLLPQASIDDVFREVEAGHADYAVVPVENSTEGAIGRTLDLLLGTSLKICGEVVVRIHQNLLSRSTELSQITQVVSHAQSLAQCHEWLNRNLADVPRIPVASNIEDEPNNTTRFLVLGRFAAGPSGQDKTSLILSTPNRTGALQSLLAPLAQAGVSMTRLESRPARHALWEYVFFVDIEGHVDAEPVKSALNELAAEAAYLKVLGSYPVAVY